MGPRHVTLIGGTGYVGRHLARAFAEEGWRVRVAARNAERGLDPAGAAVEAVRCDLLDEATVAAAVAGADVVINLVGIGRERGQSFASVHVEGAARVARLARAAGAARLLHVSALGNAEDAPSAADRTKAQGEIAVRAAFPPATILRPSLVYGPGDHFFTGFAAMARRSPALVVIGGGRTLFQPIHIADAVATVRRALADPATAGRTFALTGPGIFTFRQLFELMLATLGLRRAIVSVPFPLATALARASAFLPDTPLTVEEVRLLRTDKIAGDLPTPASLGIAARPLREGLSDSLAAPG
jgi:NADH dehydrogenase